VRIKPGLTLLLETKGFADNQSHAKHDAARRWVMAANNWGELGRWDFAVTYDPQMLPTELASLAIKWSALSPEPPLFASGQ
jgi:type III restriction enzyme